MAEKNEAEAAAAEAPYEEGQISDAEVLSALGLDEHLMPIGDPQVNQAKGKPAPRKAPAPASGENAGQEEEEESSQQDELPSEAPDTGEESEEEDSQAESQEEAEDEDEEEEEEEAQAPKGISAMQKRIDKLTARRHELEEEMEGLRASLQKANKVTLTPSEGDPLSDLNTEEEVEEHVNLMRHLRRWCFQNLDGGEITNSKGETVDLSGAEVKQRLSHAEDVIQHFAPQRREYLRERAQFDAMARRAYPALYQDSSLEATMMANFLRRCPEFMRQPNYKMIIGDAIRGMNLRLAEEAKKGGKAAGSNVNGQRPKSVGAPVPKLAPRPLRAGASPLQTLTNKPSGASARLQREFLASGDKQKLEQYILSTL